MRLISLSCPSCGANFGESCRHGNRFVCEYCGGTTYVNEIPTTEEEVEVGEKPSRRVPKGYHTPLCFINGNVPDNAELNTQLDAIMDLQKEFPTSDSIAKEMVRVLSGRKEVTTDSWQPKDHKKIARRVNLEPGENLLLYKCAALLPINRLKAGMFLTDRRIGYTGLFEMKSLHYADIKTFLVEIGYEKAIWWYPNGDQKVFISAFGCDGRELALLLTYALLRVAESTPENSVVELKIK